MSSDGKDTVTVLEQFIDATMYFQMIVREYNESYHAHKSNITG